VRAEVRRLAPDLKVAVVLGDNVTERIGEFLDKGYPMTNMDTAEPLSFHPRPGLERERLPGSVSIRRGARNGCRRGALR